MIHRTHAASPLKDAHERSIVKDGSQVARQHHDVPYATIDMLGRIDSARRSLYSTTYHQEITVAVLVADRAAPVLVITEDAVDCGLFVLCVVVCSGEVVPDDRGPSFLSRWEKEEMMRQKRYKDTRIRIAA